MRYALVNGTKAEPFPGGYGRCPVCGLDLQAQVSACPPHWTHVTGDLCDPLAEPLTPWHMRWQDLVKPEFVEVAKKGHRADLMGNGDVVISLQHAPISSDEIRRHETLFKDMVWMFNANQRFAAIRTGTTAFFGYGADDYPKACNRLVFLDFGRYLVQVTRHTDSFDLCSGFGIVRSHAWFAEQLLSSVLKPYKDIDLAAPDETLQDPWQDEVPYWTSKEVTEWLFANKRVKVPEGEAYLILNYLNASGDSFVWRDVIAKYPDLANGWSVADLERMREFLKADVVILRGGLRLLPTSIRDISYSAANKEQTRLLLIELEGHIAAGRIPMLEESAKDHLLTIAKPNARR